MNARLRDFARTWGPPALAFAALVLAMAWRLWTPIASARRAFNYDALWEYWGDLRFFTDSIRAGELPLWNPHDRLGYPFHADPQAGVLYPLTWPLAILSALSRGAWWVIPVKALLHLWLLGLGTYAFARRRGLDAAPAYLAGAFVLLTYPVSKTLWTALTWSMAWAPWALCAIDAWVGKPSRRTAAAVALTLAMAQLAGAPGGFFYALLVALPWAVWAGLARVKQEGGWKTPYARALLTSGGLAFVLFLALVAAQMKATGGLVSQTLRADRDLEFIGASAFGADDLFGFLVPRMPGEGAYLSWIGVLLAAIAVTATTSGATLVLAGTAILGVLLAFGDQSGVLPLAASAVPVFGLFRRAHRYLYVTTLPLGLLAAHGLHALRTIDDDARRRVGRTVLVAGAVAALVFGLDVVLRAKLPAQPEPLRDAFALALVSSVASAILVHRAAVGPARWRPLFAILCVVGLTVDLFHARHVALEQNYDPIPKLDRDRVVRDLAGLPEARVYDRSFASWRPGIRLRVRDLGGYEDDPLALSRFHRFLDVARNAPRTLGHAGVRWLLEGGGKGLKRGAADGPALRPVKSGVTEVLAVAPTVSFHDAAVIASDAADAQTKLIASVPGTRAILEAPTLDAAALARATDGDPAAPPTVGTVVSRTRNTITAQVTAPTDGVLVIGEGWGDGWTATLDGAATPLYPANAIFRAVLVPAGAHTVALAYRARGFIALGALTLIALGACLALLLLPPRRA